MSPLRITVGWVLVAFLAAHGCGTRESSRNGHGDRAINTKPDSELSDTLFYLDIARPRMTQVIDPRAGTNEPYKFVQAEVFAVTNPRQHSLTFQVHYQANSETPSYLGSFSLYPADNPGKFIVATQGKVKNEGSVILSLVRPEQSTESDSIRVAVKKLTFF